MATVFRARQLDADRDVALKLPHVDAISDPDTTARFMREFKILSRLCHPHIMTLYSLGMADSVPYAVCEYIDGISLRARLNASPLEWQSVVRIALQISNAMQYAHDGGILHRDLKPENILLSMTPEPDYVKLIDFGLSRAFLELSESQKLTKTGFLVGSPYYMAPEQVKGKADQRSDIYALACLLFEILSGEHLFDADTALGVLSLQCNENPLPRLSTLRGRVPDGLLQVLSRALAKEPEKRYQSMSRLAGDLESLLDKAEKAAGNAPPHKSGLSRVRLIALGAVAASAAFLAVSFCPGFFAKFSDKKEIVGSEKASSGADNQKGADQNEAEKTSARVPDESGNQIVHEGDLSPKDAATKIPMLTKTLIQLQKKGHGSPKLLFETHLLLAKAYQCSGEFIKAAQEFKAAAAVYPDPCSADHFSASCAEAVTLSAAHHYIESAESFRETIDSYEKACSKTNTANADLIRAKSAYALALIALENNSEAYKIALSGLHGYDQHFGNRNGLYAVDLSWSLFSASIPLGKKAESQKELDKTRRMLLSAGEDNEPSGETGLAIFRFARQDYIHGHNREAERLCKLALKFVGNTSSMELDRALKTDCDSLLSKIQAEKNKRASR